MTAATDNNNNVIIPCSHKTFTNDPCSKPRKKLYIEYSFQQFESCYYRDLDGRVASTPFVPVSIAVLSDPMNPFCVDCQLALLRYFNAAGPGACHVGIKVLEELYKAATDYVNGSLVLDDCNNNNDNDNDKDNEEDSYYFQVCLFSRRPFSDEELIELVAGSTQVGPTPASESAIEALETVAVEELSAGVRGDNCTVCLEGLISGVKIIRRLPCQHLFHSDCIIEWLRTSHVCPLCRFELKAVDQSDDDDEDSDDCTDDDDDDEDDVYFFDALDE